MIKYVKNIVLMAFSCMMVLSLHGSAPVVPKVADLYNAAKKDLMATVDKVIDVLKGVADSDQKTAIKQDLFDFVKKLDADAQKDAMKYQSMPPKNRPADLNDKINAIIDQRRAIEKARNYMIEQLLINCGIAC